jgi:hypothetical protein
MSLQEELQERAAEARAPFDRRVAASMAIIAALLAVVSVLGHMASTEEIVLQQRAADQWAFSQAKNLRRYQSEVAVDLLSSQPGGGPAAVVSKYRTNLERYQHETEGNQSEARKLETERDVRHHQAVRLEFGEVFLEIAIVFASLAILTKRAVLWWGSLGSAALGLTIALTTTAIR